MILLPAIDLHQGQCVRLLRGDYATAHKVADSPLDTAAGFQGQGARWMHMVDLDGAKAGMPQNAGIVCQVARQVGIHVEVGGGIRDMATVEHYLEQGVSRVILGSAALQNPAFVKEAVGRYGGQVAVGIDALGGKAAAQGWTERSQVDYIELAKEMEQLGVEFIICTDIQQDGTLAGPNLDMLDKLNRAVGCNIIASGGVSSLQDILALRALGLYGAIAGKALYAGALDLAEAITACQQLPAVPPKTRRALEDEAERYFWKGELTPAIVQDGSTGEVLMLAYMNRESLIKTLETGYTWFYSRSRQALWNKGETSGHTQQVLSIHADCDDDTLLIRVKQTGPACHTGKRSCFFKQLTPCGQPPKPIDEEAIPNGRPTGTI